jgi:hypothetical protein
MDFIIQYLQGNAWFNVFTAVVALASAIAAATKTPEEGTTLAKVYKIIDWLALNVGKAKDKNPSIQETPEKNVEVDADKQA